jgi:SAM-dependent methyltransferase
LIAELETAGRENLDAEHVARYDAKEDADADAEVGRLRALGLDESSTLVDLGAGTGQLAIAAAGVCRRVVAVDVSPVMLRLLRTKATGLANLDVEPGGFLTYEHSGPPVDFVYSRYALHHLPDFWKAVALRRIREILRPRGILRLWDVVYGFAPADAEARVEEWCATGGSEVETEWSRAELEEHVRDESSTFTWLLEPMIEQCGFTISEAWYSDDQFSARYVLTRD